MAKKTSIEEVQQLIDLGKEKGFLTYEEVNDILPADMVSSMMSSTKASIAFLIIP